MTKQTPVLFNSALDIAIDTVKGLGTVCGDEIMLVRDLRGRIRVVVRGRYEELLDNQKLALRKCSQKLTEALGAYGFPPDRAVLYVGDLEQGEQVFVSSDRLFMAEEGGLKVWLLDRQIIGQDWVLAPIKRKTTNRRVTFFGIKGGVGRSTALAILAWQLAKKGKKVLVFDLDLESPGVSSTLLSKEYLPDYGIVDWFIEDGVGQGNSIEDAMIAPSPLARDLQGEILIIPAYGRNTGDYMPKLARCYSEFSGNASKPWAERLQQMVEQVERKEEPDLVILDSRAGLHDIAAVSVTRMNADAFLFAVDSEQTWRAYEFLFSHWRKYLPERELLKFRHKLQIVAGMVPETGMKEYLKRFRERAWDLFRDHLYDKYDEYDEAEAQTDDAFSYDLSGEAPVHIIIPGGVPEAFIYDLSTEDAPHYPFPVYWSRELQEFDPLRNGVGVDERIVEAAMGSFMAKAENMLFPREENV
ncbi:MAG: ParA family protein [Nitrospirae bacterium]|nr:ParA family protein [Nitrospirota bacterium]